MLLHLCNNIGRIKELIVSAGGEKVLDLKQQYFLNPHLTPVVSIVVIAISMPLFTARKPSRRVVLDYPMS